MQSNSTALQSGSPPPAGVWIAACAVTLAAMVNLACALQVLYASEVYVVGHKVQLPPGRSLVPAPAAWIVAAAVLGAVWLRVLPAPRRAAAAGRSQDRVSSSSAVTGAQTAHAGAGGAHAVLSPQSSVFLFQPRAGLGPTLQALLPAAAPVALLAAWIVPPSGGDQGRAAYAILMVSIAFLGWSAAALGRVPCAPGGGVQLDAGRRRRGGLWLVLLAVLGLLLVVLHVHMQERLLRAWQLGSPDIGLYAEMLQNVLRGRGLYCEAFGHTFFAEHFSPGLYLLVPLYALWPRIELLMVVGAAAVTSGCLAVYALARARGGSTALAAGLAVIYLLHPSTSRVIYGGSYGFHEILLALPLMLWSFRYGAQERWGPAVLCALAALSFKEDVAVIYAAWGLYLAVVRKRRSGWVWSGLATGYFLLVIYVLVPAFREDASYSKLYLYESLGGGPGGILTTLLHSPHLILQRALGWNAAGFALALVVPLGLYPLRRPVMLAALPTFAFICLMDTPDFASIRFWHQTTLLPVLWLATVEVTAGPRARRGALAGILACALLTHYAMGFSPGSRVWQRLAASPELQSESKQEMMAQLQALVPRDATIQATARLAAHFIDRDRVYPLHRRPEQPVDWIVVDFQESWTGPETRPLMEEIVGQALASGRYEPAWQLEAVVALRRR